MSGRKVLPQSKLRKVEDGDGERRPVKLIPWVMLNTGLRIGKSVAIICSNFWESGGTAFFVEESSLRSTAYCPDCEVCHRVRPMVDAFAEGMFAVVGLFGDAVDMNVNVPQLLVLLARAQEERAIAFPAERRTA